METEKKFKDLKISKEIKDVLEELKHTEMFPIQAEAIPKLLRGDDLIGQAQTGTGKTAAFSIPILERVDPKHHFVQAIILVPTRELAVQVNQEIQMLGKYKKFRSLAIYGGVSIDQQINTLEKGVQIVIGTPGRIIDHINRGTLELGKIKILVLDEADRMMDMGFIDDIRFILETTPKDRQTLLFSATIPDLILNLAKNYMKEHHILKVSEDEITVKGIKQVYIEVDPYKKVDALKAIFKKDSVNSAIIFCNTKAAVDRLVEVLQRMKFHAKAIHGNFSQARRNRVLQDFKSKRFKIMVATDVAARGLDIKDVSHIINYNVPRDPKDYVHRIGRTGRAGKGGKAIVLVTSYDKEKIREIEWYMDAKIEKADYDIPKPKQGAYKPKKQGRGHEKYFFGDF